MEIRLKLAVAGGCGMWAEVGEKTEHRLQKGNNFEEEKISDYLMCYLQYITTANKN
jgi:chaperonin GroEL (HSP60 family)